MKASNRGAETEQTENEDTDIRTNEQYNLQPRPKQSPICISTIK